MQNRKQGCNSSDVNVYGPQRIPVLNQGRKAMLLVCVFKGKSKEQTHGCVLTVAGYQATV